MPRGRREVSDVAAVDGPEMGLLFQLFGGLDACKDVSPNHATASAFWAEHERASRSSANSERLFKSQRQSFFARVACLSAALAKIGGAGG